MSTIIQTKSNELALKNQKSLLPVMILASLTLSYFAFSSYLQDNALTSKISTMFASAPTPNTNGVPLAVNENYEELDVTGIVTQALAFKSSLSTTLQSDLEQTYTSTLAGRWSNLPCGSSCRNGVGFEDLSTTQLAAAKSLIAMALSTSGYDEFEAISLAEDALIDAGANSSQYNSNLRWIAFLNTPSTSGAWMLQFGGHHYAANISYNGEEVIGATPFFVATEPTTFTLDGTYYEPMEDEREALQDMLASFSSTEFSTAELSTTFSDVLMAPGESNGNSNTFPTTKVGVQCNSLTSAQKDLVMAAIATYVEDMDDVTAASLMALYEDEIDDTYIAYSGSSTVGTASSFLTAHQDYVRIDGPSVWIEFACQNGVVIPDEIHYHSVWRDHESDYGVDLTGDAIDNYLSVENHNSFETKVTVFPNPSTEIVTVDFGSYINGVEIKVTDISGKLINSKTVSGNSTELNISTYAKGIYIVAVKTGNKIVSKKIIKN